MAQRVPQAPPIISLFSGAMGLDLGFEAAGFEIRVSQDVDPWCVQTMAANNRPYLAGDIRSLIREDPACSQLLKAAGLEPGEAFAVIGGPPCQPFSTAGRRGSISDPRGSLFTQFAHVVDVARPRFFVMENVKGLLSAGSVRAADTDKQRQPQRHGSYGPAFATVLRTFEELGYKVAWQVLDAVHYGVPQFRERLIIIGSRDHETIMFPRPTHYPIHQEPSYRWQTLRSAIEDLELEPGPGGAFSEERLRILRMIPPGGNWRSLPRSMQRQALGGAFESGGGKVGFYRRLSYDEPSPTLVTSPVQKATMLCHPTQDRPLSVREYARLQQFPDDWRIGGTPAHAYRQIGNAVPVGLAKAIALSLRAVAEGHADTKYRRERGTSVHKHLK